MARLRLERMSEIPLLDLDEKVAEIAKRLVADRVVPESASEDAVHISCAAVHRVDYLLTWNCRHIANPQIRRRIQKVLLECGVEIPVICTPEELLSNE